MSSNKFHIIFAFDFAPSFVVQSLPKPVTMTTRTEVAARSFFRQVVYHTKTTIVIFLFLSKCYSFFVNEYTTVLPVSILERHFTVQVGVVDAATRVVHTTGTGTVRAGQSMMCLYLSSFYVFPSRKI